jgi:hypothetical protein
MNLREKEVRDGFKWLVCAGSAAVLLSLTLFWADNTVMGGAAARDKVHNEELHQLRVAQASLPARVTDSRQTLPLSLEAETSKLEEDAAASSH